MPDSMSDAKSQIHGKFKLFTGELGADLSLGKLATDVEQFASRSGCAAKSIGVEYLEGERRLVISLGYREGEAGYPIRLRSVSLGTASKLDAAEIARLEKAMTAAAEKLQNVLCHELFVTEKREFVMVFMTHGST